MLTYDPIPWLLAQEGPAALRARRSLGLHREGDQAAADARGRELSECQLPDGSFGHSLLRTAGVLSLLSDVRSAGGEPLATAGVAYLLSVLEEQPGYARANAVRPGGLRATCDLCGFFGPYADRDRPAVLAWSAREANHYREFEPLLGPREPARAVRRSSWDRVGPGSCFAWGLVPLCYTIEAVCRAGHAHDPRLAPAVKALLGAQRESGGWCRNLAGHPSCTLHAIRALGAHPELRHGVAADAALRFLRAAQAGVYRPLAGWWRGSNLFAALQALAAFDLTVAREILRPALEGLARRQQRNGTFGAPFAVERVVAALLAVRTVEGVTVHI